MTAADRAVIGPMALSVEHAARALGVSREDPAADIEAGAPTNPDGTLNVVHYATWLNLAFGQEPLVRSAYRAHVAYGRLSRWLPRLGQEA